MAKTIVKNKEKEEKEKEEKEVKNTPVGYNENLPEKKQRWLR